MAALKWLLVGTGDIARKRVAPALAGAAGSEIAAMCNPGRDSLQSLASQYGVKERYSDFNEALRRSSADAVYLATPVWLHADHAVSALEAGKHIIVEKPLGLNADDCGRILASAGRSGKKAACAYFRRFFPRYEHARGALDRGELGRIVSARLTYLSWFDPGSDDPKRWRVQRTKSGGGPVADMGCHMLDVVIGLFGMPVSVYARCRNLVFPWDVEDSAGMIMTLQGGADLIASFSWCSRTWRHEFEIVGTEARLDWLPYDTGPVVLTAGRDTRSLDLPNADNVHLPLVRDFVEAVANDRPVRFSLEESARTNVLMDAIYRSSREKREVEVTEAPVKGKPGEWTSG